MQLINNIDIIDLEGATMANGTSSLELMSRAKDAFISWFISIKAAICTLDVICGKGNNGADGFLIAKGLWDRGYRVRVLHCDPQNTSANQDFRAVIQRKTDIEIIDISKADDIPLPSTDAVLIDALLGNGINRPLEGTLLHIVTQCNQLYPEIYAVDTPSGLGDMDDDITTAMRCTATLAFEYPKMSFFNPDVRQYTGEWSYTSIGLVTPPQGKYLSKTHMILPEDLHMVLQKRAFTIHKGRLGRVLHIIGRHDMKGAGIIAAQASLASGAGITHGYSLDGHALSNFPQIAWITSLKDDEVVSKMDVIAIGPGLGQTHDARKCLDQKLMMKDTKLVLDADALNIIADEGWIGRLPSGSILTPHIGEFNRLFPGCKTHHCRIQKQREVSQEYNISIVLKGPYTSTSDTEGHIYYTTTGNTALAKGGSGDVLTGMVASLRARQDLTPHQVGYAASYIHGLAADLYVTQHHEHTLTPYRLIKNIDSALLHLMR